MPTKILVVDDEPDLEQLIRQKFRRNIRDNEMIFVFARSGVDALEKIKSEADVDVVLTDINMPEMDGLTLLARIDELEEEALKSVVVSAYGDMDNIRVAMNRGAFDFVTKPIDLQDLTTTIEKALREAAMIKESLRTRDALVAIQQELSIAQEIQASMLPQVFPPFPDRKEFELFASMIPAREVGGDLYDFFAIDDHRIGFLIGDVSGKGVPAALLMAISRTLFRSLGEKGLTPVECVTAVNKTLVEETLPHMFVTMLYGVLNAQTGEVAYCCAGHNWPYIVSPSAAQIIESAGGLPVGVSDAIPFSEHRVTLAPGDAFFLYTDGVTEAIDSQSEFYGEQRLADLLNEVKESSVEEMVKRTTDSVLRFSIGVPQADDITCLALRYLGS